MSKEPMSAHYAPEDANLPVTMTVADHYEGIRQAQEAAWEEGAKAQAAGYDMAVDVGTNPYSRPGAWRPVRVSVVEL